MYKDGSIKCADAFECKQGRNTRGEGEERRGEGGRKYRCRENLTVTLKQRTGAAKTEQEDERTDQRVVNG